LTKIPANKITQFIAANEKIIDIKGSTTGTVLCSISTKVPPNTVAVLLMVDKITGAGSFYVYPNEGTTKTTLIDIENIALVAISNQRLKLQQTVIGNDFDLYMFGYFVEGTVKTI